MKHTQYNADTQTDTFTDSNGLLVRKYQLITNVVKNFLPRLSLRKTKPWSQKIFCCFQMLNTGNIKNRWSEKDMSITSLA